MFGKDRENTYRADYYGDENGRLYRSDGQRRFSPLWLLPILLIPLALLFWGGAQLLKGNNAIGELTIVQSPTPAVGKTQVGVGGGPEDITSTPAAKVTTSPTPKATTTPTPIKSGSKPKAKTEVGVGGGPDDPSVPSMPSTGHGW